MPPDTGDFISLSPDVRLARSALGEMLPQGTPITMPPPEPAARQLTSTAFERAVAASTSADEPSDAAELGRIRVALLRELSSLPDNSESAKDNIVEAIAEFAVEAWKTSAGLRQIVPRRTILWNEELAPNKLIERTMLLADHVLYPDKLLQALRGSSTNRRIRAEATRELQFQHLIRAGYALPMPDGVAQTTGVMQIEEDTRATLANTELVQWVRSQLVVEGPTARDVLFVNAVDDLERNSGMWFHGRIDPCRTDPESGTFEFRTLGKYDPTFDYSPWISQVTDGAVANYVQRTERRLAVSDVLGAEYVAASPFEARMLQRRGRGSGASNATLWADVPALRDVRARDLAKMLSMEDAVEDLRAQVRAAMTAAQDFGSEVSAVQALASDIERSSRTLTKRMATYRNFSVVAPAAAGGLGVVVGAAGGVSGVVGAALGLAGGLSPAIGEYLSQRREAAYLFTMPKRRLR